MLQMDFDFILTDFYDTYEFENNFAEIELIDKGIEVLSIEGTADLAGTTRTAKLKVSYELELESNQRDDSKVLTKEID
jgi:lipocalin